MTTKYVAGFLTRTTPDESDPWLGCRRVLLVTKARPEWQKGRLNGVGGKVEKDEHPGYAMAREFKEETGIATLPEQWRLRVVLEGPRVPEEDYSPAWRVYFFHLPQSPDKPRHVLTYDPSEPVDWYDVDDLPAHALPNLRWLIPLCMDKDVQGVVVVQDETVAGTKPGR